MKSGFYTLAHQICDPQARNNLRGFLNEETLEGMNYLRTEMNDSYWSNREKVAGILEYLGVLRHAEPMEHWHKDS